MSLWSLEQRISLVLSVAGASSVQLIIQAVPVVDLLFIARGYVGSTHVQLHSGGTACFVSQKIIPGNLFDLSAQWEEFKCMF